MEWFWLCLTIYGAFAVFTFAVNNTGPVSPGLAALRALVWPFWLLTGQPDGRRYGPD